MAILDSAPSPVTSIGSAVAAPFTGGLSLAAPFILKGLSGLFGGKAKRQKEERERRERIQKQINEFLTEQRSEERLRSRTALDATQLDPLFQAKAGFRGDIARDLGGLDVSAGVPFRTTSRALDPGAQDVARASFAKTAKAAGPLGAETKAQNLADIMARLNALLRK